MALTLLTDFSNETTVDGSVIQAEHENIANKFSGNIVDTDINASAGISLSKLAAQYQYYPVYLYDGGITAVGFSNYINVPGVSGVAEWEVDNISWYCSDVANKDAVVYLRWGEFNAAGAFVPSATSFGPYTVTHAGAGAGTGAFVTGGSTALPFHATASRVLVIETTTAVTGAGGGSLLNVTVNLRRAIQAA